MNTETGSSQGVRPDKVWLTTGVIFGLICAAALAAVVWALTPPQPLPENAPADQFSAYRALAHIEAIGQEPHPMGSESIAQVRTTIVEQLENIGLEPEIQHISAPDYYNIHPSTSVDAANIIARLPGTSTTGAVVLLAHYDTVPTSPGANDCSACVAVLLETARALTTGPSLKNDVILLFTDGEEPSPKYGAAAFMERHPLAEDVRLVLSFEAVGSRGPAVMYETGHGNAWSIREFARSAPLPVAYSYLNAFFDLTTSLSEGYSTDFGVFKAAGMDGLSFAYIYNGAVYHTPDDNIDSVSLPSLQHHGSHALELTRHFGRLDLTEAQPDRQKDSIYFTLFRTVLVHYPADWALPLVILAGIVLAGVITVGIIRGGLTTRGLLASVAASSLSTILLCLLVAVIWWALVESQYRHGQIVGLVGAHGYLAVFLLGSVTATCALCWLLKKKHNASTLLTGTLLWWWALALVTTLALPGLSYVFLWPMLFAGIGQGIGSMREPGRRLAGQQLLILVMVTVAGIVLLTPITYDFFHAALPRPGNLDSQVVQLMGVPVLLSVLLAWLLIPHFCLTAASLRVNK